MRPSCDVCEVHFQWSSLSIQVNGVCSEYYYEAEEWDYHGTETNTSTTEIPEDENTHLLNGRLNSNPDLSGYIGVNEVATLYTNYVHLYFKCNF